ncbi:VOC family protein [Peribacillus psychrosaccharolyticus]|uniref:VOC family protein n=1 Tax=Peribacillus psychrosaccharolyticus TaxID=1407 RepID=A0A974S0M1_PERPY|nr:VOC family protein [Peribacillus psychrosaccharolyticus]MEC2055998.1 VOC family protein [Peribacillus psychrosaccharolyticus]MED3743172.1 VOC family protein [Peribacillus psychrosaccharolyticus]QQT00792.1 VOC family protein [Peribacillus psychrosaccharolyticus]
MNGKLVRVGTSYFPVTDVVRSSSWYIEMLGAELSYQDEVKAILNLANQSVFLVKSQEGQTSNFFDSTGNERFSLTFEVNGLEALEALHREFSEKEIRVGVIENRGHTGRNFVFYDLDGNKFDVWSELSPIFKENYLLS